jgi:hypothetical protein
MTACAATPTPAPTSATPTTAPVFATDEEALAAATEAYANYLEAHDAFWADEASSEDEFLDLSSETAREGDIASIRTWKSNGWRAVGLTTFDSIRLKSNDFVDGVQRVGTYLCLDVSSGDVIGADGISVADPNRPMRLPLEVDFMASRTSPVEVKISRSEVWSGTNFC